MPPISSTSISVGACGRVCWCSKGGIKKSPISSISMAFGSGGPRMCVVSVGRGLGGEARGSAGTRERFS